MIVPVKYIWYKLTWQKGKNIVAKFNLYGDKFEIKATARDHFTNSSFSVGDQYPNVIQDRHRKPGSYIVQALQAVTVADLSCDTLYIEGSTHTPPAASTAADPLTAWTPEPNPRWHHQNGTRTSYEVDLWTFQN